LDCARVANQTRYVLRFPTAALVDFDVAVPSRSPDATWASG